jgi:hypothetical protein
LIEHNLKGSKIMSMEDLYADLLQVETQKKAEEEADDEDAVHGTWVICHVEQVSSYHKRSIMGSLLSSSVTGTSLSMLLRITRVIQLLSK